MRVKKLLWAAGANFPATNFAPLSNKLFNLKHKPLKLFIVSLIICQLQSPFTFYLLWHEYALFYRRPQLFLKKQDGEKALSINTLYMQAAYALRESLWRVKFLGPACPLPPLLST